MSIKPSNAEEDNAHACGVDLQLAPIIENAGYDRAFQQKDYFGEDKHCSNYVGCLPCKRREKRILMMTCL